MDQAVWDVTKFMACAGQHIGDKRAPEVRKPPAWLRQQLLDAKFGLKTATDQLRYSALTVRDADPGDERMALRARLMTEELGELLGAMAEGDTVEVADGLADLVYVVVGAAVTYGIDLGAVWREVQRANMAKFLTCPECEGAMGCDKCDGNGVIVMRDAGGKVVKPEGWTPPDVQGVIDRQWLGDPKEAAPAPQLELGLELKNPGDAAER